MTGEGLQADVDQVLVLVTPPAPTVAGARAAIAAVGPRMRFRPPDSPYHGKRFRHAQGGC